MLDVFLHEHHIGTIVREEGTPVLSFVLDDGYMTDPLRPVLGQQFEDRRHHRVFRQARYPGRLPSFFANLLPEGALQAIVEAQHPGDDDATLALLGEDLPGAVVVRRAQDPVAASSTEADAFDEPGLRGAPLEKGGWRFSLAGVQLKFSAVRDPQDRFTLPFRGRGGRWILKFGSAMYPRLPENELWTMTWAGRSGISIPRIEIVPAREIEGLDPRFLELGESVFAIQRYDRAEDGTRIHQEDFAQVRGFLPEFKSEGASYESLARLVGDLCGRDDLIEFVRRVVFSILCGNVDAHLKNWSLLYPDRRTARLAPAYDLVFVRRYLPNNEMELPLAKERDPVRIGWEHLARLEKFLRKHGHDLPLVAMARDFVTRCLDEWSTLRDRVDARYRAELDRHLAALPLVTSRPSGLAPPPAGGAAGPAP